MKKEKRGVKTNTASLWQSNYTYHQVPIKKLPITEAMQMLRKAGIDVQEEEAEKIMEFLYTITQITIKEFFSPD